MRELTSTVTGSDWQPKVTAIVPCFNAAAFLGPTLDCLAAQTWPKLEILIGDDASSDDTLAIARDFAAAREEVRIVARESNLGWLRNCNDLMSRTTSELMFFAFHDDLVDPTYVEKLVAALRNRPEAVLAFSDIEVVKLDGSRHVWVFDELSGLTGSLARGLVMAGRHKGWWVPVHGLFRSEAFHRIGGIKPNARGEYSADWTWLLHMVLLGEFVRVQEVLCRKFEKHSSLSRTWPRDRAARNSLRLAGIREIRRSPLGFASKAVLVAYLTPKVDLRRRVPIRVKALLKKLLGLKVRRSVGRTTSSAGERIAPR